MARLPKSIIKKYGISKKAWSVYRAKKTGGKMAKRKRASTKRKAPYRRKARSSGMSKDLMHFGTATAYGFGRGYLNAGVRTLANKLGLGAVNVSDELLLLGTNYAIMKGYVPGIKKIKIAKDIASRGFTIESAFVGAQIAQKVMNRASSSAPSSGALEPNVFA